MKLLIASTSTLHDSPYLSYLKEEILMHFEHRKVLFIPFARPGGISWNEYSSKAKSAFQSFGITLSGIEEFDNFKNAVQHAEAFFTGGGNTFLLLKTLYETGILEDIKDKVKSGTPYMGSSAGSNITGISIGTTNDMPIVYPPSFEALQLLPFNINPHYLDPDLSSKHMGETRETRIKEFHHFNSQTVIGLREGSWLYMKDSKLELRGNLTARVFNPGKEAFEQAPGDISFFLK